jgi:hypothetical protein
MIAQQLRAEITSLQAEIESLRSAKDRSVVQLRSALSCLSFTFVSELMFARDSQQRDDASAGVAAAYQQLREYRVRLSEQEQVSVTALADAAQWRSAAEQANGTQEIAEFKRTVHRSPVVVVCALVLMTSCICVG